MSPTLLLVATAAGLLAVAFWWLTPVAKAIAVDARRELELAQRRRRPVPPGLADPDCGIASTLMAAAATGTAAAGSSGATVRKAPKRKEDTGPTRRQFLRGALTLAWLGVAGSFGVAMLGFLWPLKVEGFGGVIPIGSPQAILDGIAEGNGHFAVPAGKMYLVPYDPARDADSQYAEITGGEPFMAIYQKCVHLGCRVPWCDSSGWFECPCHGSRYNGWGEYQFGPAPRGLDRFPLQVVEGVVMVDTGTVVTGPARGSGALNQPPRGAHCT